MSQPFNQREQFPALGKLDHQIGEFWLRNPWQTDDHNLSAFERNRVVLNLAERGFVDVSHPTTADLDSDSRAVAAGDVTGDGMPDLLVRSSGGGPLRVFENQWPKSSWLLVSLRGVKSNSLGIGAKLKLELADRTLWRELYPVNSFLSQMPSRVHFGLGPAGQIRRLTVHWPSGLTQTVSGISPNTHVRITEGEEVPVDGEF